MLIGSLGPGPRWIMVAMVRGLTRPPVNLSAWSRAMTVEGQLSTASCNQCGQFMRFESPLACHALLHKWFTVTWFLHIPDIASDKQKRDLGRKSQIPLNWLAFLDNAWEVSGGHFGGHFSVYGWNRPKETLPENTNADSFFQRTRQRLLCCLCLNGLLCLFFLQHGAYRPAEHFYRPSQGCFFQGIYQSMLLDILELWH